MRMQTFFFSFLICIFSLGCTGPKDSGEEKTLAPLLKQMGDYYFSISTNNRMVQKYFNQGMVLYFGLNHLEANRSFQEAARRDEGCAMCYWGMALSMGPSIHVPIMHSKNIRPAYDAIYKAMALRQSVSPKERDLILALSKRYAIDPPENRIYLDKAYTNSLLELTAKYFPDPTILSLHAESIMVQHISDYWEKDGTPKPWTTEILHSLENALKFGKNNPFAHHLYIHAMEASPTPEKALQSAKILPSLAPGVGHLAHMPAHIYMRIGDYEKASLANKLAIDVDEIYFKNVKNQGFYPLVYYPHNYHYLWVSSTMQGDPITAIYAARKTAGLVDKTKLREPGFGVLQHYYATPYYGLVIFERWKELLKTPKPEARFVYPTGVWHFAQGMAYIGINELRLANSHLAKLNTIRENPELKQIRFWNQNSADKLLDIASLQLSAQIAKGQNNFDRAVKLLRAAVLIEDQLKLNGPFTSIQSTRRQLGNLLYETNRLSEAELTFRDDLRLYPKNGWALTGLFQTLQKMGATEEAEKIKNQLEKSWSFAE